METCCTCHFVTLESYSAISCREDEVYLEDCFGEVEVGCVVTIIVGRKWCDICFVNYM